MNSDTNNKNDGISSNVNNSSSQEFRSDKYILCTIRGDI